MITLNFNRIYDDIRWKKHQVIFNILSQNGFIRNVYISAEAFEDKKSCKLKLFIFIYTFSFHTGLS